MASVLAFSAASWLFSAEFQAQSDDSILGTKSSAHIIVLYHEFQTIQNFF
ncbi:MAG: hypothetical protein LBF15_01285 [Candidatus Peribacteria bacterium]|nr:hypothetical protein [Candidatus Peribacteria bacterium]